MDSLAAGELNAMSGEPDHKFVAYWRKTTSSLHSWLFGLLDARETCALRKGPKLVSGKYRLLLTAFPAEALPVDTASVSAYDRAPRYMHKAVKKCICTQSRKIQQPGYFWVVYG
uniref:Uncharacterized protein n=1 Tax=Saimiri boliviensis boliviensis TaxID=39432 RepID=A0A2K6U3N9_SAIBB